MPSNSPEILSNVAVRSIPLYSHCGTKASVRRKARAPAAAWDMPIEAMLYGAPEACKRTPHKGLVGPPGVPLVNLGCKGTDEVVTGSNRRASGGQAGLLTHRFDESSMLLIGCKCGGLSAVTFRRVEIRSPQVGFLCVFV